MRIENLLKFLYQKRNTFILLLLFAIVLLSLWLRIHNVGLKDLWIDEYFTEDGAFYSFKQLFEKGHTKTTLLFSLIMKFYAFVLSYFNHRAYLTPFELRMPNVIYGTLLVALVYFAIKKISDIFTGIYASLLCATNAYLIYYSQDGRYYPFMLLWVIVCMWASFSILLDPIICKNQIKYHLIYMVAGVCGMFSHYGFWIFFAVNNVSMCLILLFRFFVDASKVNFLKRMVYCSLMVLTMAIPTLEIFTI